MARQSEAERDGEISIICFCIGKAWWIMISNPSTITCGQMGVICSSRVKFHGFLLTVIDL
jgi:hypothetical protein